MTLSFKRYKYASLFLGATLVSFIAMYVFKTRNNAHLKKAEEIYAIFDKHRIVYDIDARSVDSTLESTLTPIKGSDAFITKIAALTAHHETIPCFLVGFPFKSPNHEKKTIGVLPDMAERKSLEYLQGILNEIKAAYPPGAHLIILCDGIMFAEFLGVEKEHVLAYEEALHQLVADLPDIELITSSDLMQLHQLSDLAGINTMIESYKPSSHELNAALQRVMDVARKRFALELDYAKGRKMLAQRELDEIVHGILTREECLRYYIRKQFPAEQYVRLTVHFSDDISKKFGIKVSPDSDVTPYHGVLIELDNTWKIKFKKDVDMKHYILTSKHINGIECPYYKQRNNNAKK